jgi:hypothetical protein
MHLQVAPESKIQRLQVTFQNTGWMDHPQIGDGTIIAIPILDPTEVKMVYGASASQYHFVQ